MEERGLSLSEEKTVITHIENGFDFLGCNVRKYRDKLLIKPSKQNVAALLAKVRGIIRQHKSKKQSDLIYMLNPVIRGWVNNQRFNVSAKIFNNIDFQTWQALWSWALRRHKRKGKKWIAKRYFHQVGTRKWTFSAFHKKKKTKKIPKYFRHWSMLPIPLLSDLEKLEYQPILLHRMTNSILRNGKWIKCVSALKDGKICLGCFTAKNNGAMSAENELRRIPVARFISP